MFPSATDSASAATMVAQRKGSNALSSGRSENSFDLLRLALAIGVLVSHSFVITHGANDTEPLNRLSNGQTNLGHVSVDGFFLISGFLITQSWAQTRSLERFLAKRVLRIYPAFVVMSVITAVAFCSLSDIGFAESARRACNGNNAWRMTSLKGLTVEGVFTTLPLSAVLNGSLWTIRIEFGCYLLMPIIAVVANNRLRRWMLWLTVAFVAAYVSRLYYRLLDGHMLDELFMSPEFQWTRCLSFFLIGSVYYVYADRIRYDARLALVAASALLLAMFKGMEIALLAGGSYLLFYAGRSWDGNVLGYKVRSDYSYGIYLYAFPIQQAVLLLTEKNAGPALLTGASLFPTTLLAFLSWHLVEKPCLMLKPSTRNHPNNECAVATTAGPGG